VTGQVSVNKGHAGADNVSGKVKVIDHCIIIKEWQQYKEKKVNEKSHFLKDKC